MNPYLLLLIGLLLVFLEVYLPGWVMGIGGGLLIFLAMILITVRSTSFVEVILFVIGSLVGVVLVIKGALWQIRGTGKKRTIFLESDQEGFKASSFAQEMIGKTGTALADMRPGGYVDIGGKKYQALSISGYIPKGAQVKVISGQGESLQVQLVNVIPGVDSLKEGPQQQQ